MTRERLVDAVARRLFPGAIARAEGVGAWRRMNAFEEAAQGVDELSAVRGIGLDPNWAVRADGEVTTGGHLFAVLALALSRASRRRNAA